MRLAFAYREEAARCHAMAAKENNLKVKAGLLELANQLEALAVQSERFLRVGLQIV